MSDFRVLDLFTGGGGAAEGYRRAGAEVTGVDFVKRQDRPPGVEFIKADVSDLLPDLDWLRTFDLIHASPPCKPNTRLIHLMHAQGREPSHPDMLPEVRAALEAAGVPYILENVMGADMRPDVMLCGSMFNLGTTDKAGNRRWLRRHRMFELGGWAPLGWGVQPEMCCTCMSGCGDPMCGHYAGRLRPFGVYGSLGDEAPDGGEVCQTLDQARELMAMPWASWAGITQAIPPVYTQYLATCFIAESAIAK